MEKQTIKIEVEITFEFDKQHFNYISDELAKATAIDMAIRPSGSIEDGVRLLQVCNKEKGYYWMIKNEEL